MELAEKFMQIFAGLENVHGKYILPVKVEPGQKAKGQGVTVRSPVTLQLWESHLSGVQGIGVTPINSKNMCRFGAVDIDDYNVDLAVMAKVLGHHKLPLILIRSKSGGPQLYLFTSEPVPAILLRQKLSAVASFMGYGTAEIFPKQSEILADKDDAGCWINMPYFKHDTGTRYALDEDGKAMTSEEFLARVEKLSLNYHDLQAFEVPLDKDLDDGPPCLQVMARRGIPEGMRNDVLFAFGIYAKKKAPDGWEKLLEELNQKYFLPPLPSGEVQNVVKSLKKKDYNYTCNRCPLQTFCNSGLCRTRKYGVGGGSGAPNVHSLTKLKTVPPIFFLEIETDDGPKRIELTTEELQNQQRYQRRCMEVLNTAPQIVKQATWTAILNSMFKNVIEVDVPMDSSPRGLLLEYLERFCTGRAQANAEDEIFLGKPWLCEGKHFFRLSDFMGFLDRAKFKELNRSAIIATIREIPGTTHDTKWIKGHVCNRWAVPEFEKPIESYATPKQPDAHVY